MKNWGGVLRLTILVWAVLCVYCLCRAEQELPVYEPVEIPIEETVPDEVPVEVDKAIYHREAISFFPVPLDHDIQAHIIHTCNDNGIDPAIVIAMIATESEFDTEAIGDGGESYGLMQIQPKWHGERMERLGVTNLLDPLQNVTVGMDYLTELLGKYSLESALTAYNSGSPGESEYAKTVMECAEDLK